MLKSKRIEILNRIERLNESRCKRCTTRDEKSYRPMACDCKASMQILKLGKQLDKLINPRRELHGSEKVKMLNNLRGLKLEQFTVDIYKKAVRLGIYDKEIQETLDVNYTAYLRYKNSNGFPLRKEVRESVGV